MVQDSAIWRQLAGICCARVFLARMCAGMAAARPVCARTCARSFQSWNPTMAILIALQALSA